MVALEKWKPRNDRSALPNAALGYETRVHNSSHPGKLTCGSWGDKDCILTRVEEIKKVVE